MSVSASKTVALVESATQLLNVVEWAHAAEVRPAEVTAVVLAPRHEMTRLQLRTMAAIAQQVGLQIRWHEPRQGGASTARTVRSLAGELGRTDRLVVGDPFSGAMQVALSVSRAAEVVFVDDGTATLEFARQWVTGEHLTRWHQVKAVDHRRGIRVLAREQIADSVRRRLAPDSGCRLHLFTCLPVDLPGVPQFRNDFAWVRGRYPTPSVRPGADLVGTSLVETGVVDADSYVRGVAGLIQEHGVTRYFAHRKEAADKLARITQLGVLVARPHLPLEIVARRGPVARTVISFPSTVVHTLPLVLADAALEVAVCDISGDWYSRRAPVRSEDFLGGVTASARDRHHLTAVAC